jgi:hypothetical protein
MDTQLKMKMVSISTFFKNNLIPKRILTSFIFIWFLVANCSLNAYEKPCVTGKVYAQMGNNFFQIATASALAWDHDAEAYFPDLKTSKTHNIPTSYQHVFFRCKSCKAPNKIAYKWVEPDFAYHPITYRPNMKISGFFQSEKYFVHQREKLFELFAPHPNDWTYIKNNYQWLIDHPSTVGVQVRYYKGEEPNSKMYIQFGRDYFSKALGLFPEETLFIVSSDNIEFAKKIMPQNLTNIIFLEGEPYYIDFFLLSLCKHNIISNSSFGWWAAWLNKNPSKTVIAPKTWLNPNCGIPTHDVCPKSWVLLDASWE